MGNCCKNPTKQPYKHKNYPPVNGLDNQNFEQIEFNPSVSFIKDTFSVENIKVNEPRKT